MKASKKEKLHFLEISNTSLFELEAQSEVCLILGYWTEEMYEQFEQKRREVGYLLYRYMQSIKAPYAKTTSDTFDTTDTYDTLKS